jgi:hypothetical protein
MVCGEPIADITDAILPVDPVKADGTNDIPIITNSSYEPSVIINLPDGRADKASGIVNLMN